LTRPVVVAAIILSVICVPVCLLLGRKQRQLAIAI